MKTREKTENCIKLFREDIKCFERFSKEIIQDSPQNPQQAQFLTEFSEVKSRFEQLESQFKAITDIDLGLIQGCDELNERMLTLYELFFAGLPQKNDMSPEVRLQVKTAIETPATNFS